MVGAALRAVQAHVSPTQGPIAAPRRGLLRLALIALLVSLSPHVRSLAPSSDSSSLGGAKAPAVPLTAWECSARRQRAIKHAAQTSKKFLELTPDQLQQLVDSYTNTSAMHTLAAGQVVGIPHSAARHFWSAIRNASASMLSLCTDVTGLAREYKNKSTFALPVYSSLGAPAQPQSAAPGGMSPGAAPAPGSPATPSFPLCNGKRVHLVAVSYAAIKQGSSASHELSGTFRFRGLGLSSYMLLRGHDFSFLSFETDNHLFKPEACMAPGFQFPFAPGNASSVYPGPPGEPPRHVVAFFIKFRPGDMARCFKHHGVPMVHDIMDGRFDYKFYRGSDLILATNRISAEIYRLNTDTRSAVLYHQPANTFGFHRANRTRPVSVVAMTHQPEHHHGNMVEMELRLTGYCRAHNLTLRVGSYVGHGFDQEEYRQYVRPKYDPSDQMGYVMGYSSVDIMVLMLPCEAPELICIKPTTRMLTALSLGIPTIVVGSASYLDLAVEYGYPLVATSPSHAVELLELLVRDGKLRQAISELGLRLAARFSLDAIGAEFERQICSVLKS